jgi:lambda family phage portal protein
VRKVRGSSAGNPFGFALQVIDIDRLDTKLVRAPERGLNEIKMGVEVNAFGRAVAYWLRPYHPGEMFLVDSAITGSHVRVPADEIQHVYRADRPEALRGIPWMHSAMIRLNHLGAYEEAAVIAARVGAAKMGFFTTPDGQPPGDGEDAEDVPFTEVEPGAFGSLPTGTEFTPFNPDYPHQMFADFVKANLRGISSGMGVAYHALANDLTSVSFCAVPANRARISASFRPGTRRSMPSPSSSSRSIAIRRTMSSLRLRAHFIASRWLARISSATPSISAR